MGYKILISPRAQSEIENIADYYALNSRIAPQLFIAKIKEAYEKLEKNPFYRIQYKRIRTVKIKRFPYSLYYIIHEEKYRVSILSCFHNKRDPQKRPGK
jgi:plasmid stabilization system protein ParE